MSPIFVTDPSGVVSNVVTADPAMDASSGDANPTSQKPFHFEDGTRYPLSFFIAGAVTRREARRRATETVLQAAQLRNTQETIEAVQSVIQTAQLYGTRETIGALEAAQAAHTGNTSESSSVPVEQSASHHRAHPSLSAVPAGHHSLEALNLPPDPAIIMAAPGRPTLQTTDLPATGHPATISALADDASATASPARGREMRMNLMQKLRPPPLVHVWEFWHDRQERTTTTTNGVEGTSYADRLTHLQSITDVREFWSVYNNFDISKLKLRDSIHLFHKGVKPVWEDQRNLKGGAWTFRVPKQQGEPFWKEICMMAIGEQLQHAVATKRIRFIDDICGVSLSVRFTSYLITVWNRDADHKEGINKILETVVANLPEELSLKEGNYYYKRHAEHAGFDKAVAEAREAYVPPMKEDAKGEAPAEGKEVQKD